MKKITMILTVLFATVAMTFGQKTINGSTVVLTLDGSNSTEFDVGVNPTNPSQRLFAGELLITFDVPMNDVSMNLGIMMDNPSATYFYFGDTQSEGVYKVKVTYAAFDENVTMTITSSGVYTVPQFTAADTLSSFNSGVASVDTDSYFDAGVASVDTDAFYNSGFTAGVESIDSSVIWNTGYDAGVVEGENTANEDAYNAGYTEGVNSGTGVNDFAVTNLTVYPNPTNTSGVVTIECDDFNNVEIYTIDGRKVHSTTSNTFNVSDFTSSTGIYVLVIQDNGWNTTNTRLLVQ